MRVVVVAILIAIAGGSAAADKKLAPEAQKHLDAGLALYAKADYDRASVELEAAYAIDPDPSLLYALAQAKRLGGHCDLAVPVYDKYLATLPSEAQTAAAKSGVELCKAELDKLRAQEQKRAAEQKAAEDRARADRERADRERAERERAAAATSGPTVGGSGTGEASVGGPGETTSRPFYRRHPIGTALAATGTVAVGVGIGFLISSRNARQRAEDAETRDEFLSAIDRANARRRIGLGATIGGAAVITAGILVFVLGRDDPAPTVTAGTDGTTVFVRAAF